MDAAISEFSDQAIGTFPVQQPAASPNTMSQQGTLKRVLYWGSGSPPAWRALLALTEKGLPFRSEQVTFESGVLKTPPMLTLNPRGLVPIFIDGDVRMFESLAILQYLEWQYPEPALLPSDRLARAKALTRFEEANNLSTAAGEVVYYVRRTPPQDINEEYLTAKKEALHTELSLWESYLVGTVRRGLADGWAHSGRETSLLAGPRSSTITRSHRHA